ncbi:MAG: hypothetical protein PHI18_02295 [bacterium]|nr:hypothetical protein [bacterium]
MAILLLLLALMTVGCGGPERVVYRGGTQHFPLLHDRLLRYQERTGGNTREFTLLFRYAGGRSIRVYQGIYEGIEPDRCNFLSRDSLVTLETPYPLTNSNYLPAYRQLWVDENAAPGDSWIDEDTATETTFSGFEDVTVPAGRYSRCYKTVTTVVPGFADSLRARRDRDEVPGRDYERLMANGKLVIVRWFAPGVGLVKEQLGSEDRARELIEIVQPGRGEDYRPPAPEVNPQDEQQ